MSSCLDRWEKDPFFSAAEEVQESADRMESIYRRWLKERKARLNEEPVDEDDVCELRGELHTALGTAKWQLEEFDRASKTRGEGLPSEDDAKTRHTEFVSVIRNQVLIVENSLMESEMEEGRSGLSWVRLDEGERDELAAFLSGSPPVGAEKVPVLSADEKPRCGEDCAKKAPFRMVGERVQAHRRTASAGNDSGVWAISLAIDDSPAGSLLDDRSRPGMPKVFSLSRLSGIVDSTSKKKSIKKLKHADQLHESETIPLQNQQSSKGFSSCYGRSKSCIDSCSDESYRKQLHGWIGTFQRQLQRSQYQIQYGQSVQVIFWVVAALLLIVLFVLRAI